MSEDGHEEISWGGKIGTGKRDDRLVYCAPSKAPVETEEFELMPTEQKIKADLEARIGEIIIVPNTGFVIERLLKHTIYTDIVEKRACLSPKLREISLLLNSFGGREFGKGGKDAKNYVTQAEVSNYFLVDVMEELAKL